MSAPGAERFRAEDRLRQSADFSRCYRRGRRRRGFLLMLVTHRNDTGRPRLGITASRKVGNAVVRNRVKRRIREIFRRLPQRSQLPSLDIVVHVHPTAGRASFDDLSTELSHHLGSLLRSSSSRSERGRG
ncbi:MAG: ribonuclease P protein component [Acidobacteriota bacterium]